MQFRLLRSMCDGRFFENYLAVRWADIHAQSMYQRAEKEKAISDMENIYREILASNQCVSLKTLAVTGKDLIAAGMKPGKELGDMLKWLLEQVLEVPEYNTKEKLIELAKRK